MGEELPVKPVLVIAGTARVVVGIAACLRQRGIEVDVLQFAPTTEIIYSRYIRRVYRLPVFNESPLFAEALLSLVKRQGYDMVIPTTDESLIALQRIYDEVSSLAYPGCPGPEVTERVLNKRSTLQAAARCGFDVPKEYAFVSRSELEARSTELRFPVIAKPASKSQELNFALRRFLTLDELGKAFSTDPLFGSKFLLQEYCKGVGVGIECLIWDGELQVVFQHRRLKEFPATGGVSVLAQAEKPQPHLVEASLKLLKQLGWRGVAMVEFRWDPESNRAALMEVNGRYWGSLPLSLNAGVPFPFCEWQLAHGQVPTSAKYAPGLRTLWRLGDLMRLNSLSGQRRKGLISSAVLRREGVQFLRDFFSPVPDAIWTWRDPMAGFAEFYARILKRAFRPERIRKVFPRSIRVEARICRSYGWSIGWRHMWLTGSRRLRRKRVSGVISGGCKSVLFLCSGNIMRSPIAAGLMRRELGSRQDIKVESAGLFAGTGRPADPNAVVAARGVHLDLRDHRSAVLTPEMLKEADVIFVMDLLNEATLRARFPGVSSKILRLSDYTSNSDPALAEIVDPYGQGLAATEACCGQIEECVRNVARLIQQTQNNSEVVSHTSDNN